MRKDFILILLCLLAAVILFTNLGNIYLWQDEAETAVLAKNTLKFGVPRAFDGENLITNIYEDSCMYKGWKYAAWLQFYLVAMSFWLFGETTFAARIPFALFGVGSVVMCYLLAQRLFKNRLLSRVSCAFMVFSGPFFLYMRQCRWYALTVFFTLWVLLSYLDLLERKRFSALGFIVSGILLFHSNYGIFFPVFIALGLHGLVFNRRFIKNNVKGLLFYLFIIAIFTLPSLLYLGGAEYTGEMTFARTKGHAEFYFRVLNKYLFPCGLLFLSLTLFGLFRKRVFPILIQPLNKSYIWLLIFVFISTIAFLLFADERQIRYIIHLLPLCAILMSLLIVGLLKVNKGVAVLLFAIVCFTNIFHTGSPFRKKLWVPLLDIAYELTHDYDGPVEGIVKFLKENAKSGDTVKISYGDYAVIFYTDLKVDNRPFQHQTLPEWIVPRKDWSGLEALNERYVKQIKSRYQRIVLNYPDIMWENRPDPGYHKFKTVSDWPKVVIYKENES